MLVRIVEFLDMWHTANKVFLIVMNTVNIFTILKVLIKVLNKQLTYCLRCIAVKAVRLVKENCQSQ